MQGVLITFRIIFVFHQRQKTKLINTVHKQIQLPHPRQIAYFIFMANYTISSCYVMIEYLEPPPHCEKLNICSYQTLFNDVCQTERSLHLTLHHLCLKHRLIMHQRSVVFQCCSHQLSTAKN